MKVTVLFGPFIAVTSREPEDAAIELLNHSVVTKIEGKSAVAWT